MKIIGASITETKSIVMDIGGTNFRSSIFEFQKKHLLRPKREPAFNFLNRQGLGIKSLQSLLIQQIIDTVKYYLNKDKSINLVGISFAAPITSTGIVHQACTLWGNRGRNFPIKKVLSQKLPGMRLVIVNDITAAAERYGSMIKYRNIDFFEMITVSSGIGSKIYDVRQGKVILDKRSIGGEMGHIKVDFSKNAPICDCGGKGHLGATSSGRAVERLTVENAKRCPTEFKKSYLFKIVNKPENITNKYIIEALKKGDAFTLKILDQCTFPLANCISHVSANIGVNKFIFIGGFALNLGKPFLQSVRRNLKKVDFYNLGKKEVQQLVDLGINDDNDCLIGIGLLAQKLYANAK